MVIQIVDKNLHSTKSVIQTLDLESVRREIRRYGRYGDIKNNHKGTE